MYGSIHGFLFRYSSHFQDIHLIQDILFSNLCGNKRYHQTQAGGNADGDAETGSLSKPATNRPISKHHKPSTPWLDHIS